MYEPADIVIYLRDKGFVAKEKSLLAIDSNNNKVIAYGNEAETYVNFPKPDVRVISFMRRGAIVDHMAALEFFSHMMKIAKEMGAFFFRISAIVSIPNEYSLVEKHALEDVLYRSGIYRICYTDSYLKSDQVASEWEDQTRYASMVICITKDEPKQYVKEYVAELMDYAKQEDISLETIKEVFQEKTDKTNRNWMKFVS